jgi:hypothetical protein
VTHHHNSSYGLDASGTALSPDLIRVSRATANGGATFFSSTLYSGIANRASAVSTTNSFAGGKVISPARWNKSYLLATNSNVGSIPAPFTNTPPDWVYVCRTGSRVCNVATDTLPALMATNNVISSGTVTGVASPIIGRYAFVMYDEGALIDANVAGFVSNSTNNYVANVIPTYTNSAPLNYQALQGKSYLAYADLSQIPGLQKTGGRGSGTSRQSIIDALVNWRNAAGLANTGTASGNAYLGTMFTMAKNGFLNFQTTGTGTSTTDSPFLSRQDLINYFNNLDYPPGATTDSYTPPVSSALTYLGTFTREVSAPSYCPEQDASALGGSNGGSPGIYSYHTNAIAEAPTNTPFSSTSPNPNPDLANIRWPTAFTSVNHYSDTGTATAYAVKAGDPLMQSRFSLAKISWLAATNPASEPDPSSTYATPVQACFGLVWGNPGLVATSTSNTANGGYPCWNYCGVSGSTPTGTIETLSQVASEGREPNFFEVLKAAILSGSLGLSPGQAAFTNGTSAYGWGYDLHQAPASYYLGPAGNFAYSYDQNTPGQNPSNATTFSAAGVKDCQIIQIGANIISQYSADSFPTAIYFRYSGVGNFDPVSGTSANPIYGPVDMFYGDENLPDLTRMTEFDCSTNVTGDNNPIDDTDAYNGAHPTTSLSGYVQPELWNCHQAPLSTPAVAPPKKFQIRAYGSIQLNWTWGNNDAGLGYTKGSAVPVIIELPATRPAAVIAQAVKAADILRRELFVLREVAVEAAKDLVVLRAVPAERRPVGEDARATRALPPKRGMCQRHVLFLGPRVGKIFHPRRREDLRIARAVAKGIRRPRRFWHAAERPAKVGLRHGELARQRLGRGQIRVRLDERAADHVPPAFSDELLDPREALRVLALEVLINQRLAPHERHLRVFLHQVEDGADRRDALVEPLAPIPKPDRIQMGVPQQMKDNFLHRRGSRSFENGSAPTSGNFAMLMILIQVRVGH